MAQQNSGIQYQEGFVAQRVSTDTSTYGNNGWLADERQWKAHLIMHHAVWQEEEPLFKANLLIYDDSLPVPDHLWPDEVTVAVLIDTYASWAALKRIIDTRAKKHLHLF